MRPVVITIKDLHIDYRNLQHFTIQQMIKNPALKGGKVLHAVRGVDMTVREGEIIGIIGENGAGKSTLLNSIAGIFKPDTHKYHFWIDDVASAGCTCPRCRSLTPALPRLRRESSSRAMYQAR